MKLLASVAWTVIGHLLALAVLLASFHFAKTSLDAVGIGLSGLVYVVARAAISYLDYAVRYGAEEAMERSSAMLPPLGLKAKGTNDADESVDHPGARHVKFWINTGFNCLIAVIAILHLLRTLT